MNRIDNLAGNQLYAETINLHYKKDRTMQDALRESALRKENPALDQMLYDADKADLLNELSEAKNLLTKLARGEELTEKEKKFIEENYPEFVEKAKQAKEQAETVKERMKNASSKEEKQSIVMQAYSMVQANSEVDPAYGELLGESLKKALSETTSEETLVNDHIQDGSAKAEALRKRFEQQADTYSLFEAKQ